MRDFRNAKAMAQSLRAALADKGITITVSQSLELMAKAFGITDWNTLSAAINAASPEGKPEISTELRQSAPHKFGFSAELEATLGRALEQAKMSGHAELTTEHLLLALTDDADAALVMNACGVDLAKLKLGLNAQLDRDFGSSVENSGHGFRPSSAVQRVIQRAILHVRASGHDTVTGSQVLLALFSEGDSAAVRLLGEQGMTRLDAAGFIAWGNDRRNGDAAA